MASRKIIERSYLGDLLGTALTRRQVLIASGGLSLAGILSACANSSTAAGVRYNILNVAVADLGTQTPDPMFAYSHSAMYSPIALNLGEQLVRRTYDGSYVPALATSWAISSDQLTWTFTLRGNVKMHDGSTFTSKDLVTAIKRVQNKSNTGDFVSNEGLVSAIKTINVIDDLHIAITTDKPYFRMFDDLPMPVASAYYEQVGEEQFRKQPMTAGPFKFKSQALNDRLTFTRFDDFWDPSRVPNFETLNVLLLPEESARVAGVQSGSIDAIGGLSSVAAKQLQGASGIKLLTNPDSVQVNMFFAALNPLNPTPAKTGSPVHDLRVRQAMLYGLDRASMAKALFGGQATPLATLDMPITLGYDPALKPYEFDPAKAKQLLRDAGAAGFNFTLVSKSSDAGLPQVQDLCQAIVSNWKDIGINAKYQPMEAGLQADLQDSHKFDGGFLFSQQGIKLYDPSYQASHYFSLQSDNVTADDPKLDDYNTKLSSTLDATARLQLAREYESYLYATVPALGLFSVDAVYAVGPHIKEWKLQDGNGATGPFWGLRSN